ncbi:unnamed protein product [Staurois parvus]|uniref:Uncharacterized protein n=1 Tax=Staurois parvus TaxID=386267 RepID=A0ABN9BAR1_9NEOB|nr:unnamed protein product [Staurois parvus]
MVGVTSQGSEQEKSAEVRISRVRTGTGSTQNTHTGEKHTHQGPDCRSGHHLNTPA